MAWDWTQNCAVRRRRHNTACHIIAGLFILHIISVIMNGKSWVTKKFCLRNVSVYSAAIDRTRFRQRNLFAPLPFYSTFPYITNPFPCFTFLEVQHNILPIFSTTHTRSCIVATLLVHSFTLTFLNPTKPRFFFNTRENILVHASLETFSRPCHGSSSYTLPSHRLEPLSIPAQSTWNLWRTKWHWVWFPRRISVFPCHSIEPLSLSEALINHQRYVIERAVK